MVRNIIASIFIVIYILNIYNISNTIFIMPLNIDIKILNLIYKYSGDFQILPGSILLAISIPFDKESHIAGIIGILGSLFAAFSIFNFIKNATPKDIIIFFIAMIIFVILAYFYTMFFALNYLSTRTENSIFGPNKTTYILTIINIAAHFAFFRFFVFKNYIQSGIGKFWARKNSGL